MVVADVADALADWSGAADAWFLDGFAPARNPAMWRDEVLTLVAARSAPGAVAATFTVAGQVRRGLAAAGFQVAKAPGFGRKRERLVARFPGEAAAGRRLDPAGGHRRGGRRRGPRSRGPSARLGASLSCSTPRAAAPARRVIPPRWSRLASTRAWPNPPGSSPRRSEGPSPLYEDQPDAIVSRGALQFALQPQDARRFAKIAASDLFEPGALETLTAAQTTARIGEAGPETLAFGQAW